MNPESKTSNGNDLPSIFAIGDIHGCYDKLRTLMDKIPIDMTRDTLVFIGDYIDRGPRSFDVVDYLVNMQQLFPEIVFLKGNHEDMLQRYLSGEDRLTFLMNGGRLTLEDYLDHAGQNQDSPIPEEHRQFFNRLRTSYESEDYIFVHAGLRPKIPLARQAQKDMVWIRQKFIYSDYDFGKRVIFGHTPFNEPYVKSNKIGIDTGAVYGNQLTCIKLPQVEFFSV